MAEKVIAALSGGVDSSVVAKLLVNQGYQCLGITLKLFFDEAAEAGLEYDTCCSLDDMEDASAVCKSLGIPYHVLNFGETFDREVVQPFCDSYLAGETPNPCIACNKHLKFAALHRVRAELGYDYIATGHYARRAYDGDRGCYVLLRAWDRKKDQSYMLYNLTQDQLAHTLFPLGDLSKDEVRDEARESGMVNADKDESQDICFIPDGDYASFIETYKQLTLEPGPIFDVEGNLLGTHGGLARYTVGQRKGLGVACGQPMFVIQKRVEDNALVIGPAQAQGVSRLEADSVNLLLPDAFDPQDSDSQGSDPQGSDPQGSPAAAAAAIAIADAAAIGEGVRVEVKASYRMDPVPARAWLSGDGILSVRFDEPIRACAPGQALVMYQGDVVVGGGTIRRIFSPESR